jgi:hypothetical protein
MWETLDNVIYKVKTVAADCDQLIRMAMDRKPTDPMALKISK